MRKNFILGGLLMAATATFAQDDLIKKVEGNGSENSQGYQFTTQVDLEATDVKNQGRSGTCWSYATTSFVESEMIRMGNDPVDIAEMFTVRMVYLDKADKYVRLHGSLNFGQGGALPDVLYVIKKYGAVPQEAYPGLNYGTDINNHGEMEGMLRCITDAVVKNKNGQITPNWKVAYNGILDSYLGEFPTEFEWEGKTYTPRSFADKVVGIDADDYIQLTSFTHHPFNAWCQIQVPDNWAWSASYNMPLDAMMAELDNALDNGYTVSWATDVSEKGFSLKSGLAIVPAEDMKKMSAEEKMAHFQSPHDEMVVTQENRQEAYDNYQTQDDHGLQITGRAVDQNGTKYYIVKNSWGDRENGYKTGYLHVSEAFVRYKSISIMFHKDGMTKKTKKATNM